MRSAFSRFLPSWSWKFPKSCSRSCTCKAHITPTESSHCDTAVAVKPGPFSAPRIQGELQHAAQACHKVDIWISSYLLLETRNLILLEHAGQGLSCLGAAPIRGPADGRRLDVNVDECKHADECTRGNNSRKPLMSSIQVFDFER